MKAWEQDSPPTSLLFQELCQVPEIHKWVKSIQSLSSFFTFPTANGLLEWSPNFSPSLKSNWSVRSETKWSKTKKPYNSRNRQDFATITTVSQCLITTKICILFMSVTNSWGFSLCHSHSRTKVHASIRPKAGKDSMANQIVSLKVSVQMWHTLALVKVSYVAMPRFKGRWGSTILI